MKRILILGAFAAGMYFLAAPAEAQVMLQKAVVSSGGAASSNTAMQMGSTAGQPVVGVASNGQIMAQFGFWTPTAASASAVQGQTPVSSLAIDEWPNPATSASKITVTVGISSDLDVRLFDVTGKEVWAVYSGPATGAVALDLNVSGLAAGSYILAARIPGQLVEKRISVVR